MLVLAYFFIPELKGRSLEEVDRLFASNTPIRKFKKIQTEAVETMEPKGVQEVEYTTKDEESRM